MQAGAAGGFWRSVGNYPGLELTPFTCTGSLSRVVLSFLPLLVKLWGREGWSCTLLRLGGETGREIAAVSSDPARKMGLETAAQMPLLKAIGDVCGSLD